KKYSKAAQLNLFEALGQGTEELSLQPSPEESTHLLLKFYELWKEDTSGFHLEPFVSIIRSMFSRNNNICEYSANSCSKIIHVDVFGQYRFCSRAPFENKFILGTVDETPISELKKKGSLLEDRLKTIKTDCEYFDICNCGCPLTNQNINVLLNYCSARKALFKKIEDDIYEN
ncbi:MAG: hypothetical protein PHU51_05385, partial [Candidatus Nanoarchaeia archaeon]|nr:hypothetical protein [Candidatus Nanoarchaeia archaeon]